MAEMHDPAKSATGGDRCFAGRLNTSEHSRKRHALQCSAEIDELSAVLRHERQIVLVHALGPRVFAELLGDIARRTGQSSFIADRLQAYAGLDPAIARALGADIFPPMPLELVK